MKKILPPSLLLLTFSLLLGLPQLASCQPIPQNVKSKFNADYPNAQKVKWEVLEVGFEVEWEKDGYEMELLYSSNAKILMTETGLSPHDLLEYITEEHPQIEIAEASRVKLNHETYFAAEYLLNGQEKELIFDLRGNLLAIELEPEVEEKGDQSKE